MSIRPPTTAAPANLLEDRPPTGPQSPMPRRRRELAPEGLDSMAAMERALEEAVKQDHRAEKAAAPAYQYDTDPQYRFGKLDLGPPPCMDELHQMPYDRKPKTHMTKGHELIRPPAAAPGPASATKSFVMEMPSVRGYASLQEAMGFPEKLSNWYGRGDMSSCTLVAYVEGHMDFIIPSAAVDFRVKSEADWQVIRDRVIDLLEQGKNAAYVLCNEDRERKGLTLYPDPKPDYRNDYAKSPYVVRTDAKAYTVPKEVAGSIAAGSVHASCARSLDPTLEKWSSIKPEDVVLLKGDESKVQAPGCYLKVKATNDDDSDEHSFLRAIPESVMSKVQEKWKAELIEKMKPKEAAATDDAALDAAARAEELMKEKKEFDESQQKEWDKLPLFHPGKTYTAEQAANGYRVMDGYAVSYNQNDDVHISAERFGPYEEGKTMTVINRWSDGGLAWMYWTNKAPQGSNGMLLRECVVRHGMGGWVDKKNDRRAKVIFLDAERSILPGRCFIVAMDIPSTGNRMLVKGNELNDDVFRVFRSAVPEDIQKVITLRELINARQLAEAKGDESMRCPGWWHM